MHWEHCTLSDVRLPRCILDLRLCVHSSVISLATALVCRPLFIHVIGYLATFPPVELLQ